MATFLAICQEVSNIVGLQGTIQSVSTVTGYQSTLVQYVKNAYEEKVGHSIGKGQIYKVLNRHGWRKVLPRSKHPNKASDEAIEASKKLTVR